MICLGLANERHPSWQRYRRLAASGWSIRPSDPSEGDADQRGQQAPDPRPEDHKPHGDGREHGHKNAAAGMVEGITQIVVGIAADGLCEGLEVLKTSAMMTRPIASMTRHHSTAVMPSHAANATHATATGI